MNWEPGDIEGVQVRPAVRHADERGWLSEIFRSDELSSDEFPAMGYVSVTHSGVTRGPHDHVEQTDTFAFLGPGRFRLRLWDNRRESPTHGRTMTLDVGEDNPTIVSVPPGVVHGYTNVSETDGWVQNFPNRLFAGEGRASPVDEVRYEDSEDAPFSMT